MFSLRYATREFLQKLIDWALDVPIMEHCMMCIYHIMDGADGKPLRTLRIDAWDNASVYFDGENFVVLEADDYFESGD